MTAGVVAYPFADAPRAMCEAASSFQERFEIQFETLAHFPADVLAALHAPGGDERALMANVELGSRSDPAVAGAMQVLTRVANVEAPATDDRVAYFGALQRIYRAIAPSPPAGDGQIMIAPEREGRMLAQALGWLRPDRDLAPHAKRIPYAKGLLVGIAGDSLPARPQKLVFVDGAIASGATLMALLDRYAVPAIPVEIYSIHAAREGLRAILRHARSAGLQVRVQAGHVTEGLSAKFYAVSPRDGRPVVGDLGDTIAAVAAPVFA